MLCVSFALMCAIPPAGSASADEALRDACVSSFGLMRAHRAEGASTGETQLWIRTPSSAPASEPVVLSEPETAAEREAEPELGTETDSDFEPASDNPSQKGEPSSAGAAEQPSTGDQLRQSVRVPAAQGYSLPHTADVLTTPQEIYPLMCVGSLALVAGLRARSEVRG